jgi:hypothetical protein
MLKHQKLIPLNVFLQTAVGDSFTDLMKQQTNETQKNVLPDTVKIKGYES